MGYFDVFIHTYARDIFWGSNFCISINFFFFGGGGGEGAVSEKFIFFWGVKIWGYFLGVITYWTIFRGHFYAFYGLFLRSRHRMGIFFGVSKTSNIF